MKAFISVFGRVALFFLLLMAIHVPAQVLRFQYDSLPVPPQNKNMLFYLQRTLDKNTVIYEVNYEPNGQINRKKPVKAYWLDYNNGWTPSPLTRAQTMFAYGIESEPTHASSKIFRINLVSYKKIKMYLKPSGKNKAYETHVALHGRNYLLTNIFVNIIGGTYLRPSVSYIELRGKDPLTGEKMVERVKPEED